MNEEAKHSAVMTVRVDSSMSLKHEFQGHGALLLPMVGALDYAKGWALEEIKRTQATSTEHLPLPTAPAQNSLDTELVPKDIALIAYWNTLKKLGDRIRAIDAAEPEAVFHVPIDLLAQL